jgi:hypothetical protein
MISRASMSMSAAVEAADSARRLVQQEAGVRQAEAVLDRGTETKISAPALATHPVPTIRTRGFTNRIMSWIVSPDSTCPPCELMKMVIGSSDSAGEREQLRRHARGELLVHLTR